MFRKRHPPAGSQPGTLVINGGAQPPTIRVIRYTPDDVHEEQVTDVSRLRSFLADGAVTWIDVQGLGDERVLRAVAEAFKLHPLALEDVVNVPQPPKVELFDEHLFIVGRMGRMDAAQRIETEQIGLFVGSNYVLTIQEKHGDVFDPVRARIRQGGPIMRRSGPAYLAYAILDAAIDGYYPLLELVGETLEELEDTVIVNPRPAVLQRVQAMKRALLMLRRAVWPLREAINTLIRDETPFIDDHVRVYLRDCYDHCVQIMEVVETYRDLAGGLMDLYLSSVGNRQNEIMKVLTIMATIFIPLTFLAGVYGMNFEYMPELHRRWAYPALLVIMALTAGVMLLFFRRRGWLGNSGRAAEAEDDET